MNVSSTMTIEVKTTTRTKVWTKTFRVRVEKDEDGSVCVDLSQTAAKAWRSSRSSESQIRDQIRKVHPTAYIFGDGINDRASS